MRFGESSNIGTVLEAGFVSTSFAYIIMDVPYVFSVVAEQHGIIY